MTGLTRVSIYLDEHVEERNPNRNCNPVLLSCQMNVYKTDDIEKLKEDILAKPASSRSRFVKDNVEPVAKSFSYYMDRRHKENGHKSKLAWGELSRISTKNLVKAYYAYMTSGYRTGEWYDVERVVACTNIGAHILRYSNDKTVRQEMPMARRLTQVLERVDKRNVEDGDETAIDYYLKEAAGQMARERSIAIMKRFMRKFERACDLEEKNHPEMSKSSLKEHMEGFSLRKLVEMINEKNARALDNAAQIHGLEPVLYVLAKR